MRDGEKREKSQKRQDKVRKDERIQARKGEENETR